MNGNISVMTFFALTNFVFESQEVRSTVEENLHKSQSQAIYHRSAATLWNILHVNMKPLYVLSEERIGSQMSLCQLTLTRAYSRSVIIII